MKTLEQMDMSEPEDLTDMEHLCQLLYRANKKLSYIIKQNNTIMATISDLTTANTLLDQKADVLIAGFEKILALLSTTNLSAADQQAITDSIAATQAEAAKIDTEVAKTPA